MTPKNIILLQLCTLAKNISELSIDVKMPKNIFTYCSDYTLIYNPDSYIENE